MATYGEIRYRVTKEAPGVDLALIDGYLLDRYTAILDRLRWRRQDAEVVLTTVAPYGTGTLQVTGGSANVALSGGTFTAAMTGRTIRIDDREEWYEFTFASPTTGTLDRGYAGDDDPAATFSIYQSIYPLPPDCRIVGSLSSPDYGPLKRLSAAELNVSAPGRIATGPPRIWAPYMDDGATPPDFQIELYPIPDAVYSLPLSYTAEAPTLAGTGATLLPWLRPSALVAGATSDALEHLGSARAAAQEMKYQGYLGDMVRTECLNRGPQKIRMASWLMRDNAQRALRSSNRTGPRLP